jgi:hypothetical protein
MKNMKYPSLAEIRSAHASRREYERYLFVNRFFFRPLSYGLTWAAVRLGLSSEAASWLSGSAALAAFCFLLSPGGPMLLPGIGFLFLFNFLDCVDGDISRVMRTRNPYGRFLDSLMWWADMLFWPVVGVTVWRMPELRALGDAYGISPAVWLTTGVLSTFFAAYAAYIESTFDQVLRPHWEELTAREGILQAPTPIAGKPWPEVFVRVLFHNLRVRETHYLLLALSYLAGTADLLLTTLLVVNAINVVSLLFVYCRRGRRILDSGLGREKAN